MKLQQQSREGVLNSRNRNPAVIRLFVRRAINYKIDLMKRYLSGEPNDSSSEKKKKQIHPFV